MNGRCFLAGIVVLLAPISVRADCGSIPFNPKAVVYEPNQKAVIAFNGREEILVLSTDLSASEPTKVLEVLPLPSEPKVKAASTELFSRATSLINSKLAQEAGFSGAAGGTGGTGSFGGAAPPRPAGEITFHEKIGAHDIRVVHVLRDKDFVDWVRNRLRQEGVEDIVIPPALEAVVGEYLRDDYKWFAFDIVDLGTETKSKDAIQYRFGTRSLYYPMRITRAEKGETKVRLLVVSQELLPLPDLGRHKVRLPHEPVRIETSELEDRDISDLIRGRGCLLRTWEVTGKLSAFRRDIITPGK